MCGESIPPRIDGRATRGGWRCAWAVARLEATRLVTGGRGGRVSGEVGAGSAKLGRGDFLP
jgi:hypothetical protein